MDYLAWVLIGLTLLFLVLAGVMTRNNERPPSHPDTLGLPVLSILSVAALALPTLVGASLEPWKQTLFLLALGLIAGGGCFGAERITGDSGWLRIVPVSLAGALVGFSAMSDGSTRSILGSIAGTGLAAVWMKASVRAVPGRLASDLSLWTASFGILTALAVSAKVNHAAQVGPVSALVVAIAMALGVVITSRSNKFGGLLAVVLGFAGLVGTLSGYFLESGATPSLVLALAAGLLTAWLLPEGEAPGFAVLASAIVWISVTTVAFSALKGFGVALVLCVGILTLVGLNRPWALATLAPVAGLAVYRVFRDMFPEVSRAIDLGQHYALVGVLVGILLVLTPIEWLTGSSGSARTQTRNGIAAALGGAAALVGLAAAIVLLGAKGSIGLMLGLALAPTLNLLSRRPSVHAFPVMLTLQATLCLLFAPMIPKLDLERPDKLQLLGILIAGTVICALIALFASPKSERSEVPA